MGNRQMAAGSDEIGSVIRDAIESSSKTPFLFIGSGFSRRYMNSENWEGLLRYLCGLYSDDQYIYERYVLDVGKETRYGDKPEIAECIERDFAREVLENPSLASFKEMHKHDIKSGKSLVKIAVAEHLRNAYVTSHQDEFDSFKRLTDKISGIVTTNYDTLVDCTFPDFKSYNGQDDLLFSPSFNVAEIYHIHGSINDPETLVLTSSDYELFAKKKEYLAAKLLTIFLEYPIVFVGYSLEDANIINILRSIANCLGPNKLPALRERLIFVERGNAGVSTHEKSFADAGTIEMTKVSTDDYSQIYNAIADGRITFKPSVLRDLRKQIYEISAEVNPSSKVSVSGFDGLDRIPDDRKIIIGLGKMEIGLPGIVVTADMLYRDVVLDDCYLTPNAMVEQHLEYLLKSNSGGLPVHKYVSRYDGQVYTPRLLKCIEEHSTIQSFRNNALKEASKSYHAKCNDLSVNAVIDAEGRDNAFKKLVMLDEHEIDVNDLESYLVDLMSDNPGITKGNPELRRLIRIYDLLRYKITPDKSPNSGRTVTT